MGVFASLMAALEKRGAQYGSEVVWESGRRQLQVEGAVKVSDNLTVYSDYIHFIVSYFVF